MNCSGHFGYIRLNLPLFHIGYFKKVINILQCICKVVSAQQYCARVLLPEEQISFYKRGGLARRMDLTKAIAKFRKIVGECKKAKKCYYCDQPAGKIKKMAGHPTKVLFQPQR